MDLSSHRRVPVLTALLITGLLAVGCTSANAPEHLNPQVTGVLEDQGHSPSDVDCPTLPKEKGATITCAFTESGRSRQATVENLGGSRQSDLLLKVTVSDPS